MSTNTDQVEANAAVLDVILPRLQERREAIQKEVLKYGEAPAGIKEVFELCRGFERAYVNFVNESPVASKIKEAFMADKGLAGMVRKQPFEKVYELTNIKTMTKQADGYQPHLVSPETGMRQLASESLDFVSGPVSSVVQMVYTLLLNAAREAAEKSGQFTEAALMGALPMNVPDFKNVVMPAIVSALDEWKKDAEKMAMMLVDMERSYITAGFFRHTMYHRANKIKQQQAMVKAAEGQGPSGKSFFGGRSFFPAFGASSNSNQPSPTPALPPPPAQATPPPAGRAPPGDAAVQEDGGEAEGSGHGNSPAHADGEAAGPGPAPEKSGGTFNASDMSDPNSFLAGMFEKYNGSDTAFNSMGAGLRWQKRFFIFSEGQRMVYYFKTAEDVAKGAQPRGMVNLSECVVEDLDSSGTPRPPGSPPVMSSDKANLVMRIKHRDPRQATVKDNNALVMRAENYEQKMTWLTRLRKATEARRSTGKGDASDDGAGKAGGAAGGAVFSSFGGSLTNLAEDMSWANDLEPILDTRLGQGTSLFRAEHVRDSEGRLLPAPQVLINPMRWSEKAKKATGAAAFEMRHDAIMEQLGSDMLMYTRMINDTIIHTVPKAIVHCMIRKSEKNLLERLFNVIHHLTPVQMETLLKEDPNVVQCRKEARAALEDCKQAIFVVQQLMERRNMANAADRTPTVMLPANSFAYAGMIEHLTKEQKEYYDQIFSKEHAPDAMRAWTSPPAIRSLPPAIAAAMAAKAAPAKAAAGQAAAPPVQARAPAAGRPAPGGAPPPVPQRRAPPPPGR